MNGKTYTIKSPAKINIGLYVKNKRKDGYHNIETIFYPVKLYDEIKIKIEKTDNPVHYISVKTNGNPEIEGRGNICYSAVKKFFDDNRVPGKYSIYISIKKKIPIGAGLGGGSSNAASVLIVLAKHFRTAGYKLTRIASTLGSDVPFFILGKPAYAESRGERLILLPKFKINYSILLVNPGINVSTKWAYNKFDSKYQFSGGEANIKKAGDTELTSVKKFEIPESNKFRNDFEEAVFEEYPEIAVIKNKMYSFGAVFSSMSGSGPTVYGFFEKGMNSAVKYFKEKKYKVFVLRK
jgi:4-diphosphocytidyl-2-C-methyl-D-erythritol kinase